ncbi:putative oocyst wall protein [Gregarina niphandrodes]|uniref:Oocyst wall protein n=1 Tax=Gregarina niphandrodes TaxID=110365 RepID=A0A023B927_GRENI|nr:putative oocyst wall protein [Gregarina niphandrodes]EZG71055.1 putative oocyst wall protein [Gregarina niphandrodes]|eukprot:XP_011129848.1 putative oocyst wall protein [Gregarina niphandrodes]
MKSSALFLVAAFAADDIQGTGQFKKYYPDAADFIAEPVAVVETQRPVVVEPRPVMMEPRPLLVEPRPVVKEPPVARAYDVSEPVYTCPKPGYALIGDECVSETRIESRLECPPGYKFVGDICVQRIQPQLTCRQGQLIGGICQQLEIYEADLQCPVNTHLGIDGVCSVLEPVNYIDVCPDGTVRSQQGCLAVEYIDPVFVCPPGTQIDGKKCRREVVSYKYKKMPNRMLSAVDASEVDHTPSSDSAVVAEPAVEQLTAQSVDAEDADMEGESSYEYCDDDDIAYAEVVTASPFAYMEPDLVVTDQWMPAQPVGKLKARKYRPEYAPDFVVDDVQWEKVQVPVVVPQRLKEVKVKQPKVREVVVKEKRPVVPQQVIKVVTQAAERVCPVGSRYGGTCVVETVVPAIRECPVPLIDGACARRVAVAPIASCQIGSLACNGRICKCEILTEQAPVAVCPLSTHSLMGEFCVNETTSRRLCPLGFFLDTDGTTCVRRDIEPALCLFSVTYACPDCDHHHHFVPPAQAITPIIPSGGYYKKPRKFLTGESRTERKEARDQHQDDASF